MRLLDRYLFRELLTPLAFCLIGIQAFVVVFIIFTDAQKIQDARLHFGETIEYAAASSMNFIPIVLPVSLLLALLITLTECARHNEITAMRAAGMSLWRICAPYLTVGLVASAALFALNELAVPAGSDWADRISQRYAPKPASQPSQHGLGFLNYRAHRTWVFDEFHFKTAELVSARPRGVIVNWMARDGVSRQLNADRAVYTNGVWMFYNASEYAAQTPLSVPDVLAMPEFTETPRDIERDLRFSQYEGLHSLKLDVPLTELWAYLRAHPDLASAKASEWWTKFYGRLAAPWTCLVVVFIAIPFGAASGRRNLFFGVAGSIFICFAFFVIQKVSLAFGMGGSMTPWLAAWLPNLVFGATGLALMARVR